MDPIRILGKSIKSFENHESIDMKDGMIDGFYEYCDECDVESDIVVESLENYKIEPVFVDKNKYEELQNLKDLYDNPKFPEARDKANPVEGIGKGLFLNRAAIKLANIDSVFKVTRPNDFLNKQSVENFSYIDVAGGPGGFTEYLQYRTPLSYGYGITLKEGLKWNMNRLDTNSFEITYGKDDTGDLYTNSDWFSDWILNKRRNGVDLVVADAGFETDNNPRFQEILSSGLIMHEVLIALRTLSVGGNFVLKIFDTITQVSVDLIYLITMCFDYVWIFKPLTSRPANSERYLVAKSKRNDIDKYIRILQSASDILNKSKDNIITSLFKPWKNTHFENWITENNQNNYKLQKETADNIISLMNNKKVHIPTYNYNKCLVLFNLPYSK